MQVKWLNFALQNLEEEANYIAEESPKSAKEFVARIFATVELLKTHPDLGRPGRVLGTRELVIQRFPYIVPYRVIDRQIEILRVFHTSRRWPKHL